MAFLEFSLAFNTIGLNDITELLDPDILLDQYIGLGIGGTVLQVVFLLP